MKKGTSGWVIAGWFVVGDEADLDANLRQQQLKRVERISQTPWEFVKWIWRRLQRYCQ